MYQQIGILGSSQTRKNKLYDSALKKIKLIYPSMKEQEKLSKIILKILARKSEDKDIIFLENLVQDLIHQGAEKVVLACTDLGNVLKEDSRLIDSTEVLIKKIKQKMN